jgi:hypothetical protein
MTVGLSEMLAAACSDQTVNDVVLVSRARGNDLVPEIDRLLGRIANLRNVTDRFVGVSQVLQPLAIRSACRRKMNQSKCVWIVGISGAGAVPEFDELALSLSVILNVSNEGCRVGDFSTGKQP